MTEDRTEAVTITVGGLPIVVRCASREFIAMLGARYGKFFRDGAFSPSSSTQECASWGRGGPCSNIQLDIDMIPPSPNADPDADLEVRFDDGCWTMRRGDFLARWDPATLRGVVRQSAYPYAIDSVIRIIHSLVLAQSGGGFLLHSASAVRNGRAFLFSGVSGAGKTTLSRLAPTDAVLLTDEISYVRRTAAGYQAFGTPFAGELGIAGEDIAAPIGALYFLQKGKRNAIGAIDPARAAGMLLRNILFFADEKGLVERLFGAACDFVTEVPVHDLIFRPEASAWDLIT